MRYAFWHSVFIDAWIYADYAKMMHRLRITYTKDNQEKSLVTEIKVTPPNHGINDAVKILHDACQSKGGVVLSIKGLCGASDKLHHTEWTFKNDKEND